MKKFVAVLMGIAIAAASPGSSSPVSATRTETAEDFVCRVLLPADFSYLAPVSDLAASEDILAVVAGEELVVFDRNGELIARETPDTEVLAVAAIGNSPATLNADGTVTVRAATPVSLNVPGAVDFCFSGGYALILTVSELLRIPYGEAGFDEANALAPLTLTHGKGIRLSASDSTAAVVAEYETAYKLFSIDSPDGVNWDTVQNWNSFSDVAVADRNVLILSDADGIARVRSIDASIDFSLPAGAYRAGGMRGAARFAAIGDIIYIAGNSDYAGAINSYAFAPDEEQALAYTQTVVAPEDSALGYFAKPAHALPYGEGVFVADTANDRVQLITKNKTQVVADDLDAPFALSAAGDTVTVADRGGARLSIFENNSDVWTRSERTLQALSVTDLTTRGDGVLLIADGGSIRTADGTLIETAVPALKIAANHVNPALYYLGAGGEIRRIADGKDSLLASIPACVDLDVDADGIVFALCKDTVVVIEDDMQTSHPLAADNSGYPRAAASLAIAREDGLCETGSLLLAFPNLSMIGVVPAGASGAAAVDWDAFIPPVDIEASQPASSWTPAITEPDARLYEYPSIEAPNVSFADTRVFVLSESPALGFFAQVAYERADGDTTKLSTGYVLRSRLTANISAPELPFEEGYLLHPSVLYKYPSLGAAKLGELTKGAQVTLCAMPPVTDTSNRTWIAVKYQDGVAYLPRDNVMKRYYTEPVKDYKADATVLTDGAAVYRKIDGKYEKIDGISLGKGTRVMLAETYNRSAKYAHIRYADANYGLLDCYVAVDSVEPDRLGTVESVAIALIVVTLVSGVVLLSLRKKTTLD